MQHNYNIIDERQKKNCGTRLFHVTIFMGASSIWRDDKPNRQFHRQSANA